MKNILCTIGASILSLAGLNAQNAQLNLASRSDCLNSDYCVTMQIRAEDNIDFKIGTSSLFLLYNKDALKFKSYNSLNFDEKDKCINNDFAGFDAHRFDADSPGKINTTLNLTVNGSECTNVGSEYMDIAEVCFRVIDPNKKSNVRFSERHTHFNLDKEDIQMIENVKFSRINDKLNCSPDLNFSIEMSVVNNPVSSLAEILINSLIDDDLDLRLYDVTGNLVKSIKGRVYENQVTDIKINLEELPSGVYLLINLNNHQTNELKILKQ